MNTHQTINIIADNGGGITLQILGGETEYQHYFESAKQAAQAVYDAVEGKIGDSADDIAMGWDGNDLESGEDLLSPTDEELRNGGYRIWTDVSGYHDLISHGMGSSWHNESELADLIHAMVNP